MTNLTTKIVIGVVIALVIILAGTTGFFVLRGGEGDTSTGQADEVNVPATEPGGEVVVRKETELKEPVETIKVGVILPLTGPAFNVGEEVQNSMLLASEEINGSDGLEKKVELFIEDSGGKPKEGVLAFNRLENTVKPDIYISATSSVSMALAPLAKQNEVALLAIVASAPKLTQQNEYTYRYFPTVNDDMPLVLKVLKDNSIKKVGLLYLNDDFGNAYNDVLEKEFEVEGKELLSESFLPSAKDFRTQLLKLKLGGAEAIMVIGMEGHYVNIFSQLDEIEYNGILLGHTLLSKPSTITKLGSVVDGAYALASRIYDDNLASAQPFVKKYKDLYNKDVSHLGGNGYDALNIVSKATKGTGKTGRENMVDYLATLDSYDGVFGSLKIDSENREMSFEMFMMKIENGKAVYLD